MSNNKFSIICLILCAIAPIICNPITESLTEDRRDHKTGNERIVGGQTAAPGQFPFVASIRLQIFNYHICGGSIIAERWILTTGQCTYPYELYVNQLSAVVGAHHIENDGVEHLLARIIIHEGFDGQYVENDISLVQTIEPIVFGASVSLIEIGTFYNFVGAGISAVFCGWGTTYITGPAPVYLQYMEMVTLNNLDCRSRQVFWADLVTDSTICAYSNTFGRGLCYGDEGGALVANNQLIGIASWFYPCGAGRPDGFTRVSLFAPWIFVHILEID